MLFGFDTENEHVAAGALLVYAVYRSRDSGRGPSGYDMWDQIERFVRRAAKRADDVGEFLRNFKPLMACGTINPKWTKTGAIGMNAVRFEDGSIIIKHNENEPRDFMISITEAPQEYQEKVVEALYGQTQRIILLVRDRLERERPFETAIIVEETED